MYQSSGQQNPNKIAFFFKLTANIISIKEIAYLGFFHVDVLLLSGVGVVFTGFVARICLTGVDVAVGVVVGVVIRDPKDFTCKILRIS